MANMATEVDTQVNVFGINDIIIITLKEVSNAIEIVVKW